MARIIISTKDMPREEWLEYRRLGIGGSDAGAIIGMNPYATPYSVWADKTGRLPEKEDNEAMRQGRDFEDYVAKKEQAFEDYTDREAWAKKMLVNISKAGYFSSDRTIEEYNKDIWKL